MNLTLEAFGSAAASQTNNVAAARTVAAEFYVDFSQFGPTLSLYLSALVQSPATPTQAPVIEVWLTSTENDNSGTGTLIGQLTLPVGGVASLSGLDGRLIITNPGVQKYVTFTTRAGLNVATPQTLTYRALMLAIDGDDGTGCTTTTTTLIAMRNGAKELADKVNDASISDTTWNVWINQGVQRLWELVAMAFSDHFFEKFDFQLVGGPTGNFLDYTTIPAGDFRRVRFVERDPDTNQRLKIRAFNFDQKDQRIGSFATFAWCNFRRYRLMGTQILIEPFEQAAGNYRLYYVPQHPPLTTNCSGLLPQVDEWSEYPMLYAAMKALGKEESDDSQITRQMADLKAAIEISAPSRNDGDTDVIADVENYPGGGGWGPTFG